MIRTLSSWPERKPRPRFARRRRTQTTIENGERFFQDPVILIITNASDVTADFVAQRLRKSEYIRLDSDSLPKSVRIASTPERTIVSALRRTLCPETISGVWYRRPDAIEFSGGTDAAERRHAASEFTAALEGTLALIPPDRWINHPSRNVDAGHKLEQLHRAHRLGFRLPKTLISQDPSAVRAFWKECRGAVIIKPLSSGYIERTGNAPDTLIYTNALRVADLARNMEIRRCPSLLQEKVKKQSDIRVNVVDDTLEAAELRADDAGTPRLDIRRNNMTDVTYRPIELPRRLVGKILRLVRSYGLRFAALDFLRHSDGDFVFLELNPNGQWAWLDQAGVTKTRDHLIAALRRS